MIRLGSFPFLKILLELPRLPPTPCPQDKEHVPGSDLKSCVISPPPLIPGLFLLLPSGSPGVFGFLKRPGLSPFEDLGAHTPSTWDEGLQKDTPPPGPNLASCLYLQIKFYWNIAHSFMTCFWPLSHCNGICIQRLQLRLPGPQSRGHLLSGPL